MCKNCNVEWIIWRQGTRRSRWKEVLTGVIKCDVQVFIPEGVMEEEEEDTGITMTIITTCTWHHRGNKNENQDHKKKKKCNCNCTFH